VLQRFLDRKDAIGMRKIWLDSYPEGVPPNRRARLSVLKDLLESSCLHFREKTAFTNMGVALTYGELDRSRATSAPICRMDSGCARRTEWQLCCPTCCSTQSPYSERCGGITVVNVNPLYTVNELEYQLADSGRARSSCSKLCAYAGTGVANTGSGMLSRPSSGIIPRPNDGS